MLAYQLLSISPVCLFLCQVLHMPATDSILSISLYVYNLVQSFILACYMPAYMPNIHYAKSYVFAYVNCCICYSAIVSMPVNISSSVSTYMPNALSHMLCVICRLSYAKARMPVFVCWMPCASYCKFTVESVICLSQYQFLHAILYAGTWVPNICCEMLSLLICQLQYTCIYMPAHECHISVVRYQVSLYANLDCYMSNCYISVYMPSALSHIQYAECYGLYAKLYMPNSIC
jgi:hypothetical protein